DGAIGADLMARPGPVALGLLGSGGMARSHVAAIHEVRPIRKLRVYSPTRAHRERFAGEMREQFKIDALACQQPEQVYEDADILATSIYHCLNMDYPHETYVLDDGARPEIEALAIGLGARYLKRPDNSHAKAGNLNNAFKHTSGEIIAIFDADGVPHKQFLSRLLGYFEDSKIALVQTPQSFYNLDSFQHVNDPAEGKLWHEQSLFFDVIQCGRDYHEATMWCGSGSMLRRSAIMELGGVSTGTVTEDLHTTLDLQIHGHKTVYHAEALAFCLAPSSVAPYIVQRSRWGLGCIQILRMDWWKILTAGSLSLYQRLSYIPFFYFCAIQRTVYYTAPLLYLVFDIAPISSSDQITAPLFINLGLSLWTYFIIARGKGRLFTTEVFQLYTTWSYLKGIVAGLTGMKVPFKVTSKAVAGSASLRPIASVIVVITISFFSAVFGAYRMIFQGFDIGLLSVTGFAAFYVALGIGAVRLTLKRPVSDEAYAFFDYRPLQIRTVDGAIPLARSTGIAVTISEKMVRFIHVQEFSPGARLHIELDLPDALLALETAVVACRRKESRGQGRLFETELRFSNLAVADRFELIRYFFEDATPRIFSSLNGGGARSVDKKFLDQRRQSRLPALLPVFVFADGEADPIATAKDAVIGLVVELSTTNARIKMPSLIAVGQVIRLQIPWVDVSVLAKVARCSRESGQVNPPYDIGLSFALDITLKDQDLVTGGLFKEAIPS
ncbi:MAG: glycosyltransferase, partial [Deltaproteobacteria bacterium]|nr:glycosyltransferase [Deltaproteobacteria bacterium]